MNKWIAERRLKLIAERGGLCELCGAHENLEFAHVKSTPLLKSKGGRGRGRKERVYDVIKNPEAYLLLCKVCHVCLDNGGLA